MASIDSLTGIVAATLAERHVSKQELASLMGLKSVQTLNAKLDGASELSLSEGKRLADFIGCTLDEIGALVA